MEHFIRILKYAIIGAGANANVTEKAVVEASEYIFNISVTFDRQRKR